MASSVKARRAQAAPVYQLVGIDDMTAGLDLRRTPSLMAPNRARVLKNYALSEPGALKVRPGWAAYSTSSLGTKRPQGGARVYLGSTQFTLFSYHGGVYLVPDNGVLPATSVLTGLSTLYDHHFIYDRNLVGVFDSTSTPQKSTNGSDWTRLGVAASTLASTLTVGAGASDLSTSEFQIAFTYKDRGLAFESNGSPGSTCRSTAANLQITVNVPNSTDPQVDAIVVYARNVTAGETVYRKVSSAAQSSGASSTIVITSSAWSANDEIPTNHTPAVPMCYGVNWKNRWWAKDATVGNRLRFTEIFLPQAWSAFYYIDIPFAKGSEITCVIDQGDTLLVMGSASEVYVIIGETSLDFLVKPAAASQAGALGPRAACKIEQGVLHASAEGVFLFDGASDRLLSFDIEPAWKDLMANAPSSSLERVAAVYDYRFKEVRLAVSRLYPRAAYGEFILDLNRTREMEVPAWTDTDRTIDGYLPWDGDEPALGARGRVLSWPSSGGQLFEESTGQSANGSNLRAEYEGPHLATGLNRARFIDLHLEYEPHGGTYGVETVVDNVSQGSVTLDLGSGLAVYGTGVYGTATYGGSGRRKAHTFLPLGAEGRSVWLKTVYTGQEAAKFYTYAYGMVPESDLRTLGI